MCMFMVLSNPLYVNEIILCQGDVKKKLYEKRS